MRAFRVGVAGPVGQRQDRAGGSIERGKLWPRMSLGVVTNDIYTARTPSS